MDITFETRGILKSRKHAITKHGIIAHVLFTVPLQSMDQDTECVAVKSEIDDHAGSFLDVLVVRN